MKKILSELFWPLILVAMCLVIVYANYTPGTWLTGWDTLHPEFNFGLHFWRSLFGVWREDQGLGTLAAHSHMSDLPRIVILFLFSFVMPLKTVKYAYDFLCFILGPLGVYMFLRQEIFGKKTAHLFVARAAAFLGALVYIFNLCTVQQFYTVFEMFAVQYAALGWLFWLIARFFREGKKKNIAALFVVSFLAAPMAYASLLWFAYFGALLLFLSALFLLERKRVFFFRCVVVVVVTLFANGFWLFPNFYFLLTPASKVPEASHINRLFSPESFLENQAYGRIQDVMLMRNFLFNWIDYKPNGQFGDLLPVWQNQIQQPYILLIGYSIFATVVAGIFISFRKKEKVSWALFLVFAMSFSVLMNATPPLDFIFAFLRDHISLLREGLRTPFTKFSLLLAFTFAVYSAVFFEWFMTKAQTFLGKTKIFAVFFTLAITLFLVAYGWPMFQGYLINPKMQLQIPHEYFDLFTFMKTQPLQTRVASLPVPTLFGWEYYNWGYEGAGFTWFGMAQPVLVRDFDRWSSHNETFYNELSTSVYGHDAAAFSNILHKYDITYLLLDESTITPNHDQKFLQIEEIKTMLAQLNIPEVWHENFLHIYKVNDIPQSFIYAPSQYHFVSGETVFDRKDPMYEQVGNYVGNGKQSTIFPFANITQTEIKKVEYDGDTITIHEPFTHQLNDNNQLIVQGLKKDTPFPVEVLLSYRNQNIHVVFGSSPQIIVGEQSITLSQLPALDIKTKSVAKTEIVDFGQEQVVVPNDGNQVRANIELKVGEPIMIRYFDANTVQENNNLSFVNLQNVHISSTSAQVWSGFVEDKKLQLQGNPQEIAVRFSSYPGKINLPDQNSESNCDTFQRGKIQKTVSNEKITYKANDNGAICDGLKIIGLNHDQTYLLHIVGGNVKGRGSKFYFQNLTNTHNDLEELVMDPSVDKTYMLLSWPNLQDSDYYLSTETRAFGPENSENYLDDIGIYTVPANILASIRIEPISDAPNNAVKNLVILSNLQKFGTQQYSAHVVASGKNNLLILSQGFDNGWIAFPKNNPFFIFSHLQYNGWANAWLLPHGEYDVVIFFWPQLLSFVGYALLIITCVYFLISWFNFAKDKDIKETYDKF